LQKIKKVIARDIGMTIIVGILHYRSDYILHPIFGSHIMTIIYNYIHK